MDDDRDLDDLEDEEEEKKERKSDFDLELERWPVVLRKPGESQPWLCELREMDGFVRDNYINSQKNKMDPRSGAVKDFKDIQTDLIGRCLWDLETKEIVPRAEIRKFPAKVQSELFNQCVDLNALKDDAVQTAKNS